jgi:hypothetical protein
MTCVQPQGHEKTPTARNRVEEMQMVTETHRHPGMEAWYTVEGSMCLETPTGPSISGQVTLGSSCRREYRWFLPAPARDRAGPSS